MLDPTITPPKDAIDDVCSALSNMPFVKDYDFSDGIFYISVDDRLFFKELIKTKSYPIPDSLLDYFAERDGLHVSLIYEMAHSSCRHESPDFPIYIHPDEDFNYAHTFLNFGCMNHLETDTTIYAPLIPERHRQYFDEFGDDFPKYLKTQVPSTAFADWYYDMAMCMSFANSYKEIAAGIGESGISIEEAKELVWRNLKGGVLRMVTDPE